MISIRASVNSLTLEIHHLCSRSFRYGKDLLVIAYWQEAKLMMQDFIRKNRKRSNSPLLTSLPLEVLLSRVSDRSFSSRDMHGRALD